MNIIKSKIWRVYFLLMVVLLSCDQSTSDKFVNTIELESQLNGRLGIDCRSYLRSIDSVSAENGAYIDELFAEVLTQQSFFLLQNASIYKIDSLNNPDNIDLSNPDSIILILSDCLVKSLINVCQDSNEISCKYSSQWKDSFSSFNPKFSDFPIEDWILSLENMRKEALISRNEVKYLLFYMYYFRSLELL